MSKIQIVKELHRPVRKNFERRRTIMRGIGETLQADLVEMIPYANQNQNFKYILTVIDIFSKMAYVRPVKNKSGVEVTSAMESIIRSIGIPTRNLHVDNGREFYNVSMQRMLQKYNINMYSTYSTKKAAIVERFNRTLKNKMWKQFSLQGSYEWINILQSIVDNYNHTRHRTIKMEPASVNYENEQNLLDSVYNYKINYPAAEKNKFKIGDPVRLSKYKYVFDKGYTPNWTTEVFRIKKIQYTNPITYIINDYQDKIVKGSVYEDELQFVKYPNHFLVEKIIKRQGNRLYVKWLGFSNDSNSWINKDDWL